MTGTMRSVVKLTAQPGAELTSSPIPRIRPDEILVRMKAASVCGTDLHIYTWDPWAQGRIHLPQIIGHEFTGVVVEAGNEVRSVQVGDYVSAESHIVCGTCFQCRTGKYEICQNLKIIGVDRDGAFAEYVAIPGLNAWKNSSAIPPPVATMQEPLGNAIDTVLAEEVAGKSVAVLGCGPVGLLAVGVARICGATAIYASDLNDFRLGLARRMGAHHVLNPNRDRVVDAILDLTAGVGVDVVLEMSGSPRALQEGLEILTPGGRVSLLGLPKGPVALDLNNHVIFKGARLYGITGRKMFSTWFKASRFLESGLLDLSPLVTHELKLEQFKKAMDLMQEGNCGKVILYP